jgi:DNA-binding NarL/FixJ family response regulator
MAASPEHRPTATTLASLNRMLHDARRPVWIFAGACQFVDATEAAASLGAGAQGQARAALRAHLTGEAAPGWRVLAVPLASASLYAVYPRRRALLESGWGLPEWLIPVAERLAAGQSDKCIAAALSIPHTTVRTAVARIYARLRISSRVAVAHYAVTRGLALSATIRA